MLPPGPAREPGAPAQPAGLSRLLKRADFLKAANALRWGTAGLVLQCRRRGAEEDPEGPPRVGFTVTKKVGNAVIRNRVKRRLRAAAAQTLPAQARAGHDYVLIGRIETQTRMFTSLLEDLALALDKVHAGKGAGPRRRGPSP